MATNLKEFAQELKQKAAIDEIIADYVPSLARRGRAVKGLCPFHEEKTPSFNVSTEFGFYKCFGCGAKGDVIKFIQEFTKVDFRIAVETLARQLGVPIPEFKGEWSGEQRSEAEQTRQALLAVCKLAEAFFVDQLWKPGASAARAYLQNRGLDEDQIRFYRLGFAPAGYEALLREADRRGFPPARVAEAGLAIQKDGGGFKDRFRNRIIFPIADFQGDVVAFGGRLMEGDGPKYLNSAESPIFHKGKLFYGLTASREAIRKEQSVVLLEGYMDWIALHSHGIQNALAGLGTAFGEDQARFLKRIAKEVYLHYDGDEAGSKAAFRAAELLLAQGITARVIALPEEHDPDSFIRAEGAGATRTLMKSAPSALDFFLSQALKSAPVSTPEGKVRAVDSLAPLLLAIKDPVLSEAYLNQIGGRLGIDPGTLAKSLKNRRRAEKHGEAVIAHLHVQDSERAALKTELFVLNRMLKNLERVDLFCPFTETHFTNDTLRSLFCKTREKAKELREGGEPLQSPLDICNGEQEEQFMEKVIFIENSVPKASSLDGEIRDCLRTLESKLNEREFKKHKAQVPSGPFTGQIQIITATVHAIAESNVRQNEAYFSKTD